MKIAPLEASKLFIDKYFPDCNVALLAGSTARGKQ